MNPACEKCRAKCCKVLLVPVAAEGVPLVEMRGGCVVSAGLALIPSRCEHLTDFNTCGIYERRPDACRTFPVDGLACQLCRGHDMRRGRLAPVTPACG